MRKMEMETRNYTAPTVKVVTFMVEHGFDGTLESRSITPQTDDSDGDVPGEGEKYNRVIFDGWGN